VCISRALIDAGYEMPGLAHLSISSVDSEATLSVAARLTQYAWTHWDDPVDVRVTTTLPERLLVSMKLKSEILRFINIIVVIKFTSNLV